MTIHDAHQPAGAVVAEAAPVPRVAALAFNVKGADLLFLDHLYHDELEHVDYDMWHAAEVDVHARPFGRVLVYAPLAADGVNLNTLRNNPNANIEGYSETRAFAFGISQLWPHLDLLFDDRSSPAAALLAEVRHYFE